MQKRSADIWKENILKDLKVRELIYATIKKSRAEEQDNGEVCTVRDSRYKKMLLVKEFKKEMNGIIRRKSMKTEWLPRSINQ